MDQIPGAKPPASKFWRFLHRHPQAGSLLAFFVVIFAVGALVLFVALLGPFALWLGGDPMRNRSYHWNKRYPNYYYGYYNYDQYKDYYNGWGHDFWLHFGYNLGLGAFFALALSLFIGAIVSYSVWIPRVWRNREERSGCGRCSRFFGAISIIPIGFVVPGLIMEFFSRRWEGFYIWVVPSIQAGIFVVHFFVKYLFRGVDKKLKKVIDKKMGIERVELQSYEPQETNQPQDGTPGLYQPGAQHVVQIEGESG